MTGGECLLRTLVANGVDLCLMNPGTSEMQFVSALDRVPQMRGVLCLYEGVCTGAADGYARMTGRPAATLLHLGPGLANGLSNLHNARKARSPLVNIVGEHSTQHLEHDAPLSADIEAFAGPVSAWIRTSASAAAIGSDTSQAIAAARGYPGNIATLIIPADFSWNDAGAPGPVIDPPHAPHPAPDNIEAGIRALRSGRRVGVLMGGRTLTGPGLAAAARLAGAGIAVFSTRYAPRTESGRGRFHPVRVPYFPEPAFEVLEGLDTLVLVEAKPPVSFFGYPNTPSALAPAACSFITAADIEEDGCHALEALAEACGSAPATPPSAVLPELNPDARLTPDTIGMTVAHYLPEGAIVSDEMVSSGEAVWKWLLHAAPHDVLPVTGGSIGQGLPVAVGAALARPGSKVVALEADGSAMYTLQALWTMAREALDIVVVVFNNRRYRILDIERQRTGAGRFGPAAERMIDIGNPRIDWVALGQSMGVESRNTTTVREFAREFSAAMTEKGPKLVEAVVD